MCKCKNIGMGTYDNQVRLTTPQGKIVGIDTCISTEIFQLWDLGITTIECCCGHNKQRGYVIVEEKDIPKMLELGYQYDPRFKRSRPLPKGRGTPEERRCLASESFLSKTT